MNFAVIGTRNPTPEQKAALATFLQKQPIKAVLHTGACEGIDQLGADMWLGMGGHIALHLPWKNYSKDWVQSLRDNHSGKGTIRVGGKNHECVAMAAAHHPIWSALKSTAQLFHTRNVSIVRGCEKVWAAPGTSAHGGGTAMGIKVALHMNKTLIVKDAVPGRTWQQCGCEELHP